MKHQYFNGLTFYKDKKAGYWLCTSMNGNRRQERMHRVVWEYYYGDIPIGYEIHHIDHNKDNNDISNLELIKKEYHRKLHANELTEEQRKFLRNNLNNKARPEAIKWHKSEKGIEWHKEQYKKSLGNKKPKLFKCLECGNEFYSIDIGSNKFCSNNCKSKHRRKSGVDNVTKICKCGKEFITNKYSKAIYCSRACVNHFTKTHWEK